MTSVNSSWLTAAEATNSTASEPSVVTGPSLRLTLTSCNWRAKGKFKLNQLTDTQPGMVDAVFHLKVFFTFSNVKKH